MKKNFLDFSEEELEKIFLSLSKKKYVVNQVLDWVYKKKELDFKSFSNISLELRKYLDDNYILNSLELVSYEKSSLDGTIKFNFKTPDEYNLQTVYIPQKDRDVVCISTQIGCEIGCIFCNSGKKKFVRNLTNGEIVEEIISVEKFLKKKVTGVLFMGMGEPLLNYENVVLTTKKLLNEKMFGLGRRHITISTIGLVDKIYDLAKENLGVRLAISLHSTNDELRKKIVPKKVFYKIEEILSAGKFYIEKNKTNLTIEYILISGLNDEIIFAKELIELLKKLKFDKNKLKINLIPYNDIGRNKFVAPQEQKILEFKNFLINNGLLTFIRQPRGYDIKASCGQLGY